MLCWDCCVWNEKLLLLLQIDFFKVDPTFFKCHFAKIP